MAERIVLHVGFWKCGSTSLQETLRANSALLADRGVVFPSGPVLRQRLLVDAFHDAPETLLWNTRQGRPDPAALEVARRDGQDFLSRHLKLSEGRVLALSCEHYMAMPPAALAALRDALAPHTNEIRIVVYLRHPVVHARSAVQEQVKQGSATIEALMEHPQALRIHGDIEKVAGVFGHENMIVKPLEGGALHRGSVVQDFLHAAAPGTDFTGLFEEVRSNPSLSMEALLIANELARLQPPLCPDGSPNPDRGPRDWMHAIRGAPVQLDAGFEAEIQRQSRFSLNYLKRRWGITLDPPARRDGGPSLPPETSRSLAALLNDMSLRLPPAPEDAPDDTPEDAPDGGGGDHP